MDIALRRALFRVIWAAIAFLFVWYAWRLLLLAFAGLLLAIILHAFADLFQRWTHHGPKSSFALTIVCLVALIGLAVWLIAPRAISEATQVVHVIPSSLSQTERYLNQTAWGAVIVRLVKRAMSSTTLETHITSVASRVMEALGAAVGICTWLVHRMYDFHSLFGCSRILHSGYSCRNCSADR